MNASNQFFRCVLVILVSLMALVAPSGASAQERLDPGWQYVNSSWYYGNADGSAKMGWLYDKSYSAWFYLDPAQQGKMLTGFYRDTTGSAFISKSNGALIEHSWVYLGSAWYYAKKGGYLATGWLWDPAYTAWFYLDRSTTKMVTGWLWDPNYNAWFYLGSNGAMYLGYHEIGGRGSSFATNGVWLGYENRKNASSTFVLVNKRNPFNPLQYTPSNLVWAGNYGIPVGGSNGYLRSDAASAMKTMYRDASAAGAGFSLVSGYRSYATQSGLYNGYVNAQGRAAADTFSARPGYSEHQTGLAADITSQGNLYTSFGNTWAGQWLAQNSWKYGFILRYPYGYEGVTGYMYEPWHFRYVGTATSTAMHRGGYTTYEQYLGQPAAPNY